MALFDGVNEDYWIPLADVMTGLMLIFLLITVTYVTKVHKDKLKFEQMYVQQNQSLSNTKPVSQLVYAELKHEFYPDLAKWQAAIESQGICISFYAPEVLFATGEADLKPQFKGILNDFIPRYLVLVRKHESEIAEVRINGFASNFWGNIKDPDQVYLLNMQLSQKRSMNVLSYLHQVVSDNENRQYLRQYFSANGWSSSHNILKTDNSPDLAKSQRIEFKIILKGKS